MIDWGAVIIGVSAVAGGSGLTALLTYVRRSRKDAADAQIANSKQTAEFNIALWMEISKEQRDWRETMRGEIGKMRIELNVLQGENVVLLRKVAELDAHNSDLKRDNEEAEARVKELEARVKELERELRAAGAVVVAAAAPVPGLVGE